MLKGLGRYSICEQCRLHIHRVALPAVRPQAVEQTVVTVLMLHGEERKDGPITEGLGLLSVPSGDTFFGPDFSSVSRLYYDPQHASLGPALRGGEGTPSRPGSVAAREGPRSGAVFDIDFSRLRRGSRRWNGERYKPLVDTPPACFSLPRWSVRNRFFFEFPARTIL